MLGRVWWRGAVTSWRAGFGEGGSMAEYEELRKQRLEENKKRMEELGLTNLAQGLKQAKGVRKKPEKRKVEASEARRSSRVAAKPLVIYNENMRRLAGAKVKRKKSQGLRRHLVEKARERAVEAAEELVKGIENPTFVKPVLHFRTSSAFWLGLPEEFAKEHMPVADEKFVLADEEEKEWNCTYLAHKQGLSGGWHGFVVDHDIMDGDCCIFELTSPDRFKVHIIRAEVDEDEESEEVSDEESDASDEKKPRSRKARKVSRSTRFEIGDDEEFDDDEDSKDEEEDEEEEEFDSDVCDDHVSEEEEEEEEEEEADDEDSEGDYSPKLPEKEVDTLVAAPSRASRALNRKIAGVEKNASEEVNDDLI